MFSINDALRQTVQTNPGVGEASANRRATESELRQTQSTLLPQVRIEAGYGPEKFDQSPGVVSNTLLVPTVGSGPWRQGTQASIVVRQILFDGFASIQDIWRQTARVNAAASRVKERTELLRWMPQKLTSMLRAICGWLVSRSRTSPTMKRSLQM